MIKGNKHYYQSTYEVKNKEKYLGDKDPFCRSSWENRVCYWLDGNDKVTKWGFECVDITYYSQVDHKVRRYYPDFYFEMIDKNGKKQKYLIEVKPKNQTIPPKKPKRKTKKRMNRFMLEAQTFVTNQCKWEAAKKFCATRGIHFEVITEIEIFNRKK